MPEYLEKTVPDIRRFFIGQVIDEDPADCDFARQLGPIRGAVAVDFDQRFASWRIGWLYDIEIKLPEICEFVDAWWSINLHNYEVFFIEFVKWIS